MMIPFKGSGRQGGKSLMRCAEKHTRPKVIIAGDLPREPRGMSITQMWIEEEMPYELCGPFPYGIPTVK